MKGNNMKKVVIELNCGIVNICEKPDDIELIVKDYDVLEDDVDNLKKDENGIYMETIY